MEKLPSHPAAALIARIGGMAFVADAIGVSRQAVFMWAHRGIPPARVDALREAFPRVRIGRAVGRGRGAR